MQFPVGSDYDRDMANFLRAQVSLQSESALPVDDVTNTYHVYSSLVAVTDTMDALSARFDALYTSLNDVFSVHLTGVAFIKYYDLTQAEPRVPLRTDSISWTPSAAGPLPNECAICVTLTGAAVPGVPPARRRGRIFVGPLNGGFMESTPGGPMIDETTCEDVGSYFETFRAGLVSDGMTLRVFSRTIAGPPPWTLTELDSSSAVVTGGYVDNAFDTIRSRGLGPTLRAPWGP